MILARELKKPVEDMVLRDMKVCYNVDMLSFEGENKIIKFCVIM